MKQEIFLNIEGLLEFFKTKKLYFFGYGSLLWKPDFAYSSFTVETLEGFYRDACILATHYRGTRTKPGLVFGLLPGKSCIGKLFSIEDDKKEEVIQKLWKREMIEDVYLPAVLQFKQRHTLAFLANTKSSHFCNLPKAEKLALINTARGSEGRCLDYIKNAKLELQKFNLVDPLLEELFS